MKAVRILQALIFALLAVYLLVLHGANPSYVVLPLFFRVPVALAMLLAVVIGWFLAWLPASLDSWRQRRRIRSLETQLHMQDTPPEVAPPSYASLALEDDAAPSDFTEEASESETDTQW